MLEGVDIGGKREKGRGQGHRRVCFEVRQPVRVCQLGEMPAEGTNKIISKERNAGGGGLGGVGGPASEGRPFEFREELSPQC